MLGGATMSASTLLVLFAGIFVRLLFQQTAYWTWQHEARPYPWTEWTKQLCQPNKKPKRKTSNPGNERKMKMKEHNSIGFKCHLIVLPAKHTGASRMLYIRYGYFKEQDCFSEINFFQIVWLYPLKGRISIFVILLPRSQHARQFPKQKASGWSYYSQVQRQARLAAAVLFRVPLQTNLSARGSACSNPPVECSSAHMGCANQTTDKPIYEGCLWNFLVLSLDPRTMQDSEQAQLNSLRRHE
jgi:hypothetical protein